MRSRRLISGPVFRSQSSETIGPPPRTDAASDSDDDKGVMGNPGCPWLPFLFCSALVKSLSTPTFPHSFPINSTAVRKERPFADHGPMDQIRLASGATATLTKWCAAADTP